jgi:UDP-N-acetylglucosamine 2-epimerase (non-hydrolysing)
MKVAPVYRALTGRAEQTLVHTGQHYDALMSDVFFDQLGLPWPDVNLDVGSATHAVQTAQVMTHLEPVIVDRGPDLVLVYGDVNSTMAGALVCAKLQVPVGHVEAGLRSGDRSMPEEINRLVTDAISDLLFTPSEDGNCHLQAEGVPPTKIHLVGNVMIDTLVHLLPLADTARQRRALDLSARYLLVTLHRPSNVDDPAVLRSILEVLETLAHEVEVVFPMHPRTRAHVNGMIRTGAGRVRVIDPLGYIEFLALQRDAAAVITDSGGIQEETTFLGVPCLTVRENTERPVTLTSGTNLLVGCDPERLLAETRRVLNGHRPTGRIPPLWDGKASTRIAEILLSR